MALVTIGPLHIMGVCSSVKNPIDIHWIPYFTIGFKVCPSLSGFSLIENSFGKEGPYISASSKPTLHPIFLRANAMFVANVDFPTPPLALEIAIVYFVPLIGFFVNFFAPVFPFNVSFMHLSLPCF